MPEKVRILILEDVPSDAELVQRELRKMKISFVAKCVDTREAFLAAFESFSPDLILSDYTLPAFDGMTALRLAGERAPEVPVIIVTGSISEETAVECMKAGAADYVIKEHLVRLISAVEGALERKRERERTRRAEQRLSESEARLVEAQGLARVGSWAWDMRCNEASCSDELYRIFGVAAEDFDGSYESFLGVVHPDDRDRVTRAVQKALDERQHYSAEYRVVRPDGTECMVQARGKATYDEAGQPVQLTGTVQDITERRLLEEQLRQAQKLEAVGRLAGGVAHDFNNLLTVVLGESEMALEDLPDDHPIRDALQAIHSAGTRAGGLTRQLLAFSRKQIVERVVFDLNELVIGVDKMLRRLIGEDIELIVRTSSDPVVVSADRGQIEQVLVNLAVNARDAMPQGGKLVIETDNVTLGEDYARGHADAVAGDYALISVSDTGTGMTPEVKARLFEPFFTTKERERGTGLGLAVCYGIAKQFGGHINAYTESGLGTTMKVYLSRVAQPAEAPSKTVAASAPRGTETILLVEDEESVRRMGIRILRGQGYRVLEAADGERALQLLEGAEGHVHLLLCDVVMPGMGGRELAQRVADRRPEIKVLFASGYTDDVILQNQLLEGDVALLRKPFTRSALASKVREVLDGEPSGTRALRGT